MGLTATHHTINDRKPSYPGSNQRCVVMQAHRNTGDVSLKEYPQFLQDTINFICFKNGSLNQSEP